MRSESPADLDASIAKSKHERPKKRKAQSEQEVQFNGAQDVTTEEKSKKRQKHKGTSEASNIRSDNEEPTEPVKADTKREKRKKRKQEKNPETTNAALPVEVKDEIQTPLKKKHKNKTGFPDPGDDTSLSDQARKALAYSFVQFHRPSKWKFNKARQNWLLRNIWSGDAIPEIYIPLLISYLTNVQGRVRENLINTCNSILDSPKPEDNPTPTNQASPSTVPSTASPIIPHSVDEINKDSLKRVRAKAVLEVLRTSNEIVAE